MAEQRLSVAQWDWRPLARFAFWTAATLTWAVNARVLTAAGAAYALHQAILMELLTFGVSTYLVACVLMDGLQLALTLDEAAFALAERLVSLWTRRLSFAGAFFAALAVESALVLGALILCRETHAGARLARLAGEVLR
ncbi:MAG: hypothetical protein KGM24_01690 [Elusimicrobia bacterium]|nr:hypothetical protein [Elusimicrobiota bacterium]